MNLPNILELIPDSGAVAPRVRTAPCDDTTSRAPQGHDTLGCSYFGLLCHSSNAVSILQPGILKRFCGIQKSPIRGSKPEESLPQRLLRRLFQIQNGAIHWKRQRRTPAAGQRHVELEGVGNLLDLADQSAPFALRRHGEFGQLSGWHCWTCEECY